MTENFFKSHYFGLCLLIAGELSFVTSHALAKSMSAQLPIFEIILFRCGLPFLGIAIFFIVTKKNLPTAHYRALISRSFFGFLSMLTLYLSLKYGLFSRVNMIVSLSALWVCLGSFFFFKERLSLLSLLSIPVLFLGLWLLLNPTVYGIGWGDLWALITSITTAISLISIKKLRRHCDSLTIIGAFFGMSTLLTLPACLVVFTHPTQSQWVALLTLSGFGFLGQWLMTLGFKYTSASIASFLKLTGLPLTILCGIFCFHDTLSLIGLLGLSLFLGALGVISTGKNRL